MSVEQRLRDGLTAELGRIDPDVESMLAEVESGASRQRTRRTVALVAVAAAAAAVVGVVWAGGSLGWLIGQDEVRPAEQPSPWDGDWVRVEDTDLEHATLALNGVAEVSGQLVAVGAGQTPILTSGDGRDWTPVDTGSAALMDVLAGGPGAIAVGSAGETAAVWTSPDALAWTAVEDPEGVFTAPGSQIADVAVGGPGFVAVGRRGDAPAVWTSSDGIAWSLATEEPGILGAIEAVTQGGPGLVAVGHVAAGPRSSPASMTSPPPPGTDPGEFGSWAAVWTSVDGVSWSRLEHDPVVFGEGSDTGMWAVVPGAPGLLAVGGGSVDGAEGLVAWTSVDGQTWAKVLVEHYPVNGGGEIYEVVSTSGGFVAVGTDNQGNDDQAGVWTSVDGLIWQKSADPALGGAQYEGMNGIVETDTGLVAVGLWEAPETPEDPTDSDEEGETDAETPPEPGQDSAAAVWVMDKT